VPGACWRRATFASSRSTICATSRSRKIQADEDAETKVVEVLARAAQEMKRKN